MSSSNASRAAGGPAAPMATEAEPSAPGCAETWGEPDPADVWRVCYGLRGECNRCPASEYFEGHGDCMRGCYAEALNLVNIVETGNPWRKTGAVSEPWVIFPPPAHAARSASPPQVQGQVPGTNSNPDPLP